MSDSDPAASGPGEETQTTAVSAALEHMAAVASHLGLPETTIQMARMLFKQAHEQKNAGSRGMDNVTAASLLLAIRSDQAPLTLGDIVGGYQAVATDREYVLSERFGETQVARGERDLQNRLPVQSPPQQPRTLLKRYVEELGMPDEMVVVATHILQDVMQQDASLVVGGRSPSGIAAAALYLAARLTDQRMVYTQQRICEVVGTSEVTVRNRYQELMNALGDEATLKQNSRYSLSGARGELHESREESETTHSPAGDNSGTDSGNDETSTSATDTADREDPSPDASQETADSAPTPPEQDPVPSESPEDERPDAVSTVADEALPPGVELGGDPDASIHIPVPLAYLALEAAEHRTRAAFAHHLDQAIGDLLKRSIDGEAIEIDETGPGTETDAVSTGLTLTGQRSAAVAALFPDVPVDTVVAKALEDVVSEQDVSRVSIELSSELSAAVRRRTSERETTSTAYLEALVVSDLSSSTEARLGTAQEAVSSDVEGGDE